MSIEIIYTKSSLSEITWVWMLSPFHKKWPIHRLQSSVIPPLHHRNYYVFFADKQPIGYISWAFFSKEVEIKYLENPHSLQISDWVSGDRLWFPDFIALEGHTLKIISILRHEIFPDRVARSLRVTEGSSKGKILSWHGVNMLGKTQQTIPDIDFSLSKSLIKKEDVTAASLSADQRCPG